MSVTNLGVKKSFKTTSVQPKARTDYSSVSATVSVSTLVRESSLRKELILTNTSSAILYVSFGNLPSSTNYAVAIPSGGVFITASLDRINGVWASAGGGQVNITEEY